MTTPRQFGGIGCTQSELFELYERRGGPMRRSPGS